MNINTRLSLKACWEMVNRIQLAENAKEMIRRCRVAEEWLKKNEIISNEEFDELMNSVAYWSREAYRM